MNGNEYGYNYCNLYFSPRIVNRLHYSYYNVFVLCRILLIILLLLHAFVRCLNNSIINTIFIHIDKCITGMHITSYLTGK